MGSLSEELASLVKRLTQPKLDLLALYPATVKAQNDDGTCDLKPDDVRFGPGLSRVAIRHGLPGVTVRVKQDARVLLGFEAGDRTKPYCALWEPGSLERLTVEASAEVQVKAPSVVLAEDPSAALPFARVGDVVQMTFVTGAPGTPTTAVGYISGKGTSKVKGQ